MKKFFSTKYSETGFTIAMLLLRVGLGLMMIPHGYDKLVHFSTYKNHFLNFLGIGSTLSLALVIFSEFFCSVFVAMGLFTRLGSLVLVISTGVALMKRHSGDIFGKGELVGLYFTGFLVLLLVGPGKASLDKLLGK